MNRKVDLQNRIMIDVETGKHKENLNLAKNFLHKLIGWTLFAQLQHDFEPSSEHICAVKRPKFKMSSSCLESTRIRTKMHLDGW